MKTNKQNLAANGIRNKSTLKKKIVVERDSLTKLDAFFDRHLTKVFWISLLLTLLFSILLFDIRISLSGDDAAYIIRASDFIKEFKYPGFQGPLYPIILSPFIFIFGIHLVPLKSLSMIFFAGCVFFTYKAFARRIPSFILSVILILISVNSYLLYYSSQTFSEAFFMLIQAMSFFILFKYIISKEDSTNVSDSVKGHLLVSLCFLSIFLTKSIGAASVAALIFYFLLKRQWKNVFFALSSIIIVFGVYQIIRYFLWGSPDLQVSSQGSGLLYKNFYNLSEGKEDLAGFINRVIGNSNLYISKHLYLILGLRPDNTHMNTIPFLTIITSILFFTGFFVVYHKNNYILFTGIYAGTLFLTSFIVLQTFWDQNRLIIPYFSLLVLFLLSGIYYYAKSKKSAGLKIIAIVIPLVLIIASLNRTFIHIKKAQKIDGIYYGLTPDWANYVRLSKWASDNIPSDKIIACRKPTISFIYGNGRRFTGIEKVPTYNGDWLLNDWENNNDKYFLITYNNIIKHAFPRRFFKTMTSNQSAIIVQDTSIYYLFKMPVTERQYFYYELDSLKIPYVTDGDLWVESLRRIKRTYSIYFPDSLLNNLIDKRAEYIIRANLRADEDQKTEKTIGTVDWYLFYLQCKYPELLGKIKQIGDDNNEPASLYKINYDRYNIVLPPINDQ